MNITFLTYVQCSFKFFMKLLLFYFHYEIFTINDYYYYYHRVNPIDYSWETHLKVPKIRIEGNYHMQGRILVIPLNGHGKCWFEPSKNLLRFFSLI